jgi:hypothetical protein
LTKDHATLRDEYDLFKATFDEDLKNLKKQAEEDLE